MVEILFSQTVPQTQLRRKSQHMTQCMQESEERKAGRVCTGVFFRLSSDAMPLRCGRSLRSARLGLPRLPGCPQAVPPTPEFLGPDSMDVWPTAGQQLPALCSPVR